MHRTIKDLVELAAPMNVLELAILLEIAKTPRCSITDIAKHMGITTQCAHFHIHRLALGLRNRSGLDLVSIRHDDNDRRVRCLELTATGRKVADSVLTLTGEKAAAKRRCDKTEDWTKQKTPTKPHSKSTLQN